MVLTFVFYLVFNVFSMPIDAAIRLVQVMAGDSED